MVLANAISVPSGGGGSSAPGRRNRSDSSGRDKPPMPPFFRIRTGDGGEVHISVSKIPVLNMIMTFTTTIQDYRIEAHGTTVRWKLIHESSPYYRDNDSEHTLPECFGQIVGMTTRPRADYDAIIFLERAVYSMSYTGTPAIFAFRPLITE